MKTNYQLETDRVIAALPPDRRPSLLLHSCCGPCSSYVLEYLTRYFDITVLYYNPNIQPEAEYEKSLYYQREVLKHIPARLMDCAYEETVRRAAEGGFDYCCSTLTVSPHKDAERINRIGEALCRRYGVRWLPSDFKKRDGYLRSIRLAQEYGLYRQDWCGCKFSHGKPADPH